MSQYGRAGVIFLPAQSFIHTVLSLRFGCGLLRVRLTKYLSFWHDCCYREETASNHALWRGHIHTRVRASKLYNIRR